MSLIALDPDLRSELEDLTASVCRGLNDPKRLMLLYALESRAQSVGELCVALNLPQASVSQHLGVLRERGLVDAERDGNRVIYALRDRRMIEAVNVLREVMNDEVARRHALRSRGAVRARS